MACLVSVRGRDIEMVPPEIRARLGAYLKKEDKAEVSKVNKVAAHILDKDPSLFHLSAMKNLLQALLVGRSPGDYSFGIQLAAAVTLLSKRILMRECPLRENRDLMAKAEKLVRLLTRNSWDLKDFSEIRNDSEALVILIDRDAYKLVGDNEDDKAVVLQAVQQDGGALINASTALKNDREVVLAAVKQGGVALAVANAALRNDREVVLAAVKQNGRALRFASGALKNDRDLVLKAVKQNGWALEYASAALQNDREVVLEAVKQNRWALQYASRALQNDPNLRRLAGWA